MMQVVVRPWQQGDRLGAWAVLREGSFSNLWPSFRIALLRPTTLAMAAVVMATCITAGINYLSTMLALLGLTACIYLACVVATLYFLYGPNFNDMNEVESTYFSCPDNHFWVAEVDGEVVGTIAVIRKQIDQQAAPSPYENQVNTCLSECVQKRTFHSSLPSVPETEEAKVAWLRRMAVKHQFRGHGIAKQLVRAVIDFCKSRDYDAIFLITTEVHQPARALYKSMGFQQKSFKPYKHVGGLISVWTYEFHMNLKPSSYSDKK